MLSYINVGRVVSGTRDYLQEQQMGPFFKYKIF